MDDIKQRKIDKAAREKQKLTFEFRHLTPDHPDFEAIAKQCVPVRQIRHRNIECRVNEVWGK